MVNILNIHTSTETAVINLMGDDKILGSLVNADTKQHAAFLHTAIKELLNLYNVNIKSLNAIGVSNGPGSYTGMRVGLAAAQGLCYSLKIPLMSYSSLEILALSAIDFANDTNGYYCPMIDARRMEVYTALYNFNREEIEMPSARIIEEDSFNSFLKSNKIYFSGSGSKKFQKVVNNKNAIFINEESYAASMAKISWEKYNNNDFILLSKVLPLYMK